LGLRNTEPQGRPPPAVQRIAIGLLAPLAKLLGYRTIDERYCRPHAHVVPSAEALMAAGLPMEGRGAG
jgi:hypothetical protein